jgi:nucleotide-binding universal stress UspA family protein
VTYKKILCPIGHEENSRAAFETAARLARESHATLYLVHVVPLPPSIVSESVLLDDRGRAHNALRRLAEQLPPAQSRVIIVRFGNPARDHGARAKSRRRPDRYGHARAHDDGALVLGKPGGKSGRPCALPGPRVAAAYARRSAERRLAGRLKSGLRESPQHFKHTLERAQDGSAAVYAPSRTS